MVVMSANNASIGILNQQQVCKDQQQQLQHLQIQANVQHKQQSQVIRSPFQQQLQFPAPNANLIQTQQQQQQAVQNQLIQQQALAHLNAQQQQQNHNTSQQGQANAQVSQHLIINGQTGTIANAVQTSQMLGLTSSGSVTTNIQPKSAMLITTAPQMGHQGGQQQQQQHGASDRPIMTISNAVQVVNPATQTLSSPQAPLQPPPNPLIAMTSLAVHPLQTSLTKEMSVIPVSSTPLQISAKESATTTTTTSTAAAISKTTTTTSVGGLSTVATIQPAKTGDSENATAPERKSPESMNTSDTANGKAMPTETPYSTAAVTGVTNGNISGNAPLKMLEKGLPKAMVKPQVLTHVIEGFVIQESNEPFPVTRQRYPVTTDSAIGDDDEPPKKKLATITDANSGTPTESSPASAVGPDQMACEVCGKVELIAKMKKKRFCSTACSKSAKAHAQESGGSAKPNGPAMEDETMGTALATDDLKMDTSCDSATGSTTTTAPVADEESCDIVKWTVQEVCDFIRNLPGCVDYVEDFETQEIDGQALLLLKENHLVNAMGMKLGPALKIVARVEALRAGSAAATAAGANDSTGSATN